MNEVRELCEQLLDVPEPPLRPSTEVLATARRSARRRNWMAAGGGAAGVLVVVAVAALVVPAVGAPPEPGERGAAAGQPADPPADPPAGPPAAPSLEAARDHGDAIADFLVGEVPDGLTARAAPYKGGGWAEARCDADDAGSCATGVSGEESDEPADSWMTLVRVWVSDSVGQGQLLGFIRRDGEPVPPGDLCSAEAQARIGIASPIDCEVITVDGEQIMVTSHRMPGYGEMMEATRFLDGGYVGVSASQGIAPRETDQLPPDAKAGDRASGAEQMLASSPFTTAELASLARDPALLP